MKESKQGNLKKLSLSKKTISSLDAEAASRIVGGVEEDDNGETVTRFWTPTTCRTISTGPNCYSYDNNGTNCQTGCATC